MVGRFFYILLNMNIMAILMVCILLIIRVITYKWLSKQLVFLLWGIVLFRLLIPVSLSNSLSMMNIMEDHFIKTISMDTGVPIFEETNEPNNYLSFSNYIQQASDYSPIVFKTETVDRRYTVMGSIWFIGVMFFLTGFILLRIRLGQQLKLIQCDTYKQRIIETTRLMNIKQRIRCYYSNQVLCPVVIGIIKPKVILPIDFNNQWEQFVFYHEIAHIKRHDNLWKILLILVACIHWFNPVVWLMVYMASKDIELACDEKVLSYLSHEERKAYGLALISLEAKFSIMAIAFSNSKIKKRIYSIVDYREISKFMMVGMIILCIICGVILLTNATM